MILYYIYHKEPPKIVEVIIWALVLNPYNSPYSSPFGPLYRNSLIKAAYIRERACPGLFGGDDAAGVPADHGAGPGPSAADRFWDLRFRVQQGLKFRVQALRLI